MSDAAELIEAASVRVQTLADDSLRLVVDVAPYHARAAFELFGQRGVPMVLARLTQQAAQAAQQRSAIEQTPEAKPKGAEVAKWLVLRGKEPDFQQFIRQAYDRHLGGNGHGTGDVSPDDFEDGMEGYTKHCVLVLCGCEQSRAEVDARPECRQLWRERIREPWRAHLQAMDRDPF